MSGLCNAKFHLLGSRFLSNFSSHRKSMCLPQRQFHSAQWNLFLVTEISANLPSVTTPLMLYRNNILPAASKAATYNPIRCLATPR